MALFFRYTENPKDDLERGTSIHVLPAYTNNADELISQFCLDFDADDTSAEEKIEAFKKAFGEAHDIDPEDMIWIEADGYWAQVLPGLCGFELESETLEEALAAIADPDSDDGDLIRSYDTVDAWAIYEGEYETDCPEGDVFTPVAILATGDKL